MSNIDPTLTSNQPQTHIYTQILWFARNRNTCSIEFSLFVFSAWRPLLQTPLSAVLWLAGILNSRLERPIRALLSFGCQLFVQWKPTKHVGRQYWILIFGDLWLIVHMRKFNIWGNTAFSRFAIAVSFCLSLRPSHGQGQPNKIYSNT